MKSKNLLTSVLAIASLALTACGGSTSSSSSAETTSSSTAEKVTLNMSVYYDNNDRHMKFIEGAAAKLPYSSLDGTTYKADDFKPVWKAIQKNLGFSINDVSPTGKVSIKDNFSTLVSSGFKANDVVVDMAQGNSDQILSEGTTNGTILDLNAHLNEMPNFKQFLNNYLFEQNNLCSC